MAYAINEPKEVSTMPSPKKCRKVCQMPQIREFHPLGRACGDPAVILTVDEYEAIRLIDRQGFSQEECSAYMQVARTTVQLIYNSARKKIAEALVEGRVLRIEGGDYQLCSGEEEYCGCGGCKKHRLGCAQKLTKEEKRMKSQFRWMKTDRMCVLFWPAHPISCSVKTAGIQSWKIRQPKHREAQGFRQRSFWWTAVSILCLQSAAERMRQSL